MDHSHIDLSVVLITHNAESYLAACLRSLPEGCELIVVDSFSTDRTKDVAQEFGAQIVEKEFIDFASQKNFALSLAKRNWILCIDSDEVLDEVLCQAVLEVVQHPSSNEVWYAMRRHLFFMGKELRFGRSKDSVFRFFKRNTAIYQGLVHETLVSPSGVRPPVKTLPGFLKHYSYQNLEDYFRKFNRYTSMLATKHAQNSKPPPPLIFIVLRPWFEFCSRYFLRLGFLDGYPGYVYAVLSSFYAFVKVAKQREMFDSR